MRRAFAAVMLALGIFGVLAAAAPTASAQALACVDLYVRVGDTVLVDNQEICV